MIELAAIAVVGLVVIVALQPQMGCHNSGTQGMGLRTVTMNIGGATFVLEVADTPAVRERGLMFRKSMPADHGMIFVFPGEEDLGFYMANTEIPLDILYLDTGGRVVSIHQMHPFDWTTVRSARPAKYAIELNQGTTQRLGVKPGDALAIPPEARGALR